MGTLGGGSRTRDDSCTLGGEDQGARDPEESRFVKGSGTTPAEAAMIGVVGAAPVAAVDGLVEEEAEGNVATSLRNCGESAKVTVFVERVYSSLAAAAAKLCESVVKA